MYHAKRAHRALFVLVQFAQKSPTHVGLLIGTDNILKYIRTYITSREKTVDNNLVTVLQCITKGGTTCNM